MNFFGLDSILLLVFTKPGCNPCAGIKRQLPETVDRIRHNYECSFIVTEVDVVNNENADLLIGAYAVASVPTLVLKKNGVVIDIHTGYDGFKVAEWIEAILDQG